MAMQLARKECLDGSQIPKKASADLKQDIQGVSMDWVDGWLKRHTEVAEVIARPVEPERIKFASRKNVTAFFDLVDTLFEENKYDPSMIANWDETFLVYLENGRRVLVRAGTKQGYVKHVQPNEHITLGSTIFADGTHEDTVVILPLTYMPPEIQKKDFKHFSWSGQPSGWIDTAIFFEVCKNHIIPAFVKRRQSLTGNNKRGILFLDGHNSRVNKDLIKLFLDNEIDVQLFVSHTSHICQPLDLCVFGMFKKFLRPLENYGTTETAGQKRWHLLKAADKALYHAYEEDYIKVSFARSGIWPRKRSVVLECDGILAEDVSLLPEDKWDKIKRVRGVRISGRCLTKDFEAFAAECEEVEKRRQEALAKKNTANKSKKKETSDNVEVELPERARLKRKRETQEPPQEKGKEVNWSKQCGSDDCGRISTSTAKWWTCPCCADFHLCIDHTWELEEHLNEEHMDDPRRKRRMTRSMLEAIEEDSDDEMDVDE